jgi:hypothetical protein
MIDKENLHYIAGFFEGEGSCGVYTKHGHITCEASITQKNPKVLHWIKSILQEAYIVGHVYPPSGGTVVYKLYLSGINARMFIMLIYPYLRFQHAKVDPIINQCALKEA